MTNIVVNDSGCRPTGQWSIKFGDALSVLTMWQDQTINCWVTSPPYFRQIDYGVKGQYGLEQSIDRYMEHITAVAKEMLRCSTPDANMFWVVRDSFNGSGGTGGDYKTEAGYRMRVRGANIRSWPRKAQLLIPERTRLAFAALGWLPILSIIWDKNDARHGAGDRPSYSYEHVLLFSASKNHYWNSLGALEQEAESQNRRPLKSVWRMQPGRQPVAATQHGEVKGIASFPLALAQTCIALGCPPNGVVADPFCGMGTTIIAALSLGRNAIGIELSPAMFQASRQRILSFLSKRLS